MIDCPVCATECPDQSRFCLSCGTQLDVARGRPTERRVITVLFADLVGFTGLSERLDPEDIDLLLREYCLLARSAIEAYGGCVEKYIGDAVAGVFGVPHLHEDDAERAVLAGLRLLDRLPTLAGLSPDGEVRARVGINTGPAFVRLDVLPGSGQSFVVGDAVNTAARLQQHAAPMRVVVGELTHHLVRASFAFEAMDPVAAKGKSEVLRAWVAKEPVSRSGIDLQRTFSSPFVGREVELAMLKGLFEKAVASREPQCALVTGEAGIGKSRLVFEFARSLDETPECLTTWRQGRALPHGDGATFWPLSEIVRQEAGVLENDDLATVESKLSRAVAGVAESEWVLARVRPLLGLDSSSASQQENFAAWQRFMEGVAARGPTVLVFDDMHWARPGALAFVEHLATYLSGVPVLLLVVARPELRRDHPDVTQGDGWMDLELHPFSAEETRRLVGLLAGAASTEIEPAVAERGGGNPFFTEELVKLLRERSLPQRTTAAGRQKAAETVLPDSLAALVAARLDGLDFGLKDLLSDAAVVGQTFWSGALLALGHGDRAALDHRLQELERREFVRAVRSPALSGESEYAFWHGLTREVAYATLPRGVRAAKHAAVAEWIESGEQKAAAAEILAHHYERALELAEAAGDAELVGRLTGPTVRALAAAGDVALPLDVVAAERHYRHALRLCPEGSPLEPGLLVAHGESLLQRGQLVEARSALERGLSGLRQAGEVRAEAVATDRLASLLWLLGDATALDVSARAVALLEDESPSPEQVKVMADWAAMCAASYEDETAIALADRALELCEELDLPVSVRALGWRGLARCEFGEAEGLDDMRRALALSKRQGLSRYGAMLYSNLSFAIGPFRGPGAAWRVLRDGHAFTASRGDQTSLMGMQAEGVEALFGAGRWDEALALADPIEAPLAEAGQLLDLASVRAPLIGILTARGQAEGSKARALLAWARATEFPDRGNAIQVLSALAEAHASLGEIDRAKGALRRAAEVHESFASRPQFGLTLPSMLRTAAGLGDLGLARRLAARTIPGRPLDDHALVLLAALEAEHEDRLDEAAGSYAELAVRWRAFGAPYEEALALLGQGRCLAAVGRGGEAHAPLRRAARVFRRLGAGPALSQALGLLSPGGTPAKAAAAAPDGDARSGSARLR